MKGAALNKQPVKEALISLLAVIQFSLFFCAKNKGFKMSGECEKCGEHCLDCKCTERKLVFQQRQPLSDEMVLNELEKVFVRLRDIKSYVKEQKERMEAIYPNETQGYLVLNYLYKN